MAFKHELTDALRIYRRMRGWRTFATAAIVPLGFAAIWVFKLNRTDSLICVASAFLLGFLGHLELRMKTMQIRLAKMADELDALRGKEPEDNLVLELNDW